MKPKKCKVCKASFVPTRAIQPTCDKYECKVSFAIKVAKKAEENKIKREKQKRLKENKELREKVKTLSDYRKEAQEVFNRYIRERDKDLPCISCQRYHDGQYHSGHYRARSIAPQLAYNEDNVWKQCSVCNNYKSGNLLLYRENLIKKIGIDRVMALENNNERARFTIEDLKKIKSIYTEKLKKLRNN